MTRLVLAIGLLTALAVFVGVAQAHTSASAKAEDRGGAAAPTRWAGEFDLVVGFGAFPALLPTRAGGQQWEGHEIAVRSESLVVGGEYRFLNGESVALRCPLAFGSVPNSSLATRSAFALGNVELEGTSQIALATTANFTISLGMTFPTAMGNEVPDLQGSTVVSAYDRYVVNRLASMARGLEKNELFVVDRVGLIPKAAFEYHFGLVSLGPFLKAANLIGTRKQQHVYVAEVVAGANIEYKVSEQWRVVMRIWTALAFPGDMHSVGVVAPELQGTFAPVDFVVGGVVPFAGELTQPQFGSIRLLLRITS